MVGETETTADEIMIGQTCQNCSVFDRITVDRKSLMEYMEDMKRVQDVFPSLSAEDRELILGFKKGQYFCPICWDEFMRGFDE